jgi:hypothetical protein
MKRFVQFFSFAAMTQVILLLNQVVLLPMQIRLWGNSETALWYGAIALATVTTVADCGLRTAGHVELLRLVRTNDPAARAEFLQVWAWIRLLTVLVTATLLVAVLAYGALHGMGAWQLGRVLLTLAYAFEALLIIRIVYLDSLGEYSTAESSYFIFAAIRLALAVPALLFFRVQPVGLCWLFLGTSVVGLALQGQLCNIPRELRIFAGFPHRLSFGTCSLVRYTMAEPVANWARLSLPVLVIASIAPDTAVTTYVALRAVYGAARTTIQQVARVASVEVLKLLGQRRRAPAGSLLSLFLLCAGIIGTALAGAVVLDNMRLLSLWLKHFDRPLFQNINLSFALASPFYCYQIIVALSFRIGQLAPTARRQYAYLLYSALFAASAVMIKSLDVYLALLVVAEILLSVSFLTRQNIFGDGWRKTNAGRRGLVDSFAGAALVFALWSTVRHAGSSVFMVKSVESALQGSCLLVLSLGALVLVGLALNVRAFRNLRIAAERPVNVVRVDVSPVKLRLG